MQPKDQANTEKENPNVIQRIRAGTPEIISNNAPRIVATLKAIGSVSMFMSKNRVFSLAGAGFLVSNGIMMLFGSKKSESQKESLRATDNINDVPRKGLFADYVSKLLHPHKYPIESATSIAMLSSSFWTLSGLFGKGGISPGRFIGGGLSLASDSNVVLTKERIGETAANPYRKGTISYYMTEIRHRPVLLSSMLNVGCDIASITGGLHEFRKGKEPNTLIVGLCLLLANLFQALFVNKNDYNIEKQPQNATAQEGKEGLSHDSRMPPIQANHPLKWEDRMRLNANMPTPVLS